MSSFLRFTAHFAVLIVFSIVLPVSTYGIYQSCWLFINFFSAVSLFGLGNLLLSSNTTSIFHWIRKRKTFVVGLWIAIQLTAIIYLIFFSPYFTSAQRFLLYVWLIVQNLSIILENLLIKKNLEKRLLLSTTVYVAIYIAIHLYILYSGFDLTVLLTGIIAAMVVRCVVMLIKYDAKVKKSYGPMYPIGPQWLFLGLNEIINISCKWLDKWVVLFLVPPAMFAIYFNGSYEIPLFYILLSAVANILVTEFSKSRHINKTDVEHLSYRAAIVMAIIILPSFFYLFLYAEEGFQFVFGNKYLASIPIFKMAVLVLPARILHASALLQVYNKNSLIVKGAVLDLVLSIILSFFFYEWLSLPGLALAFVIGTYAQVIYYVAESAKLIKGSWRIFVPVKSLLAIFILSGFLLGLCKFFLLKVSILGQLACGGTICIILISCLLFYFYKRITGQEKI